MSTNHQGRDPESDREEQIRELKRQAEQISGGEMISWESDAMSADQRVQFWRRVVEFDTAPLTNYFQQLIETGLELPDPDAIPDEELTSKLWEVIGGLARMRVYIDHTDHLSDRELYTLLWSDVLREETEVVTDGSFCEVDVLGGCSETDTYLYLKYYADEHWRQQWLVECPDYVMPPPGIRRMTVTVTCRSLTRPRVRWTDCHDRNGRALIPDPTVRALGLSV